MPWLSFNCLTLLQMHGTEEKELEVNIFEKPGAL